MNHPNKNTLITVYYQEATARELKKVSSHIDSCNDCQEYFQTLDKIGIKLAQLPDELPASHTYENIVAEFAVEKRKPLHQPQLFLLKPVLKIAFSLIIIISVLYLVQSKISLLPIWQSLSQYWIIQAIGSFGMILILFFCICSFITLSLAPILILEKTSNSKRAFSF